MGISKIRFAALSCIGVFALASSANAFQSSTRGVPAPVRYPGAVSAAPSTYQNVISSAPTSQGAVSSAPTTYQSTASTAPTYFDAGSYGSDCTTCTNNAGGCGLGSRIGSRCGGGLKECNLGEQFKLFGSACEEPRYNLGGWFQGGYTSQANDLFLDNEDRYNLHQAWFFAEKVAKSNNGELGFGWRFDGMYGTDADDTQAFGNTQDALGNPRGFDNNFGRGGGYGWALPQIYGEVAGENWSAKVGHFYTLAGYEVVTAPDNFFFSHAITMFNSEPFTHTGAVGTFNVSDDLTLYAGWTLGWDTGFDQFADGSSFLGGFSSALGEDSTLTYITTIGDLGARGRDAYSHSIVVDTAVTDKFNYVFQSDLLRVDSTGEDNFGINQYFLYSFNECFGMGSRVEWWKGDSLTGYAPHDGILPATGSHSYYEATFGINYKPHANIILRPEYRYDWSPAVQYEEGYFAVDMIALF